MPLSRPPHAARAAPSVLLALLLAGCASATPGYIPEFGKKSSLALARPFEAGSVATSGTYVPSAAELALDCKRLTGSMHVIVSRLKDAPNRPVPTALASNAQAAVASMRGQPSVLDSAAELQRERSRLIAYNGLLAQKNCKTMDLDAALAAPATPKR